MDESKYESICKGLDTIAAAEGMIAEMSMRSYGNEESAGMQVMYKLAKSKGEANAAHRLAAEFFKSEAENMKAKFRRFLTKRLAEERRAFRQKALNV